MQQPSPSAQSNYNYPLPKVPITSSQVGTRISISIGGSFQQAVWVEMSNESPYTIACYSLQGVLLNSIQPQICDIFQLPQGDNSFIVIPGILIPQAAPSSELDINIYPFGQPSGPYPFPLARQSAPVARSSSAGFVAQSNFDITATNITVAWLNVYNPSGNTLKFTFYAAIVYLSAVATATSPNLEMGFYTGTPFTGANITAVPNNTLGVSTAQVFFVTNNTNTPPSPKVYYNNTIRLPAGTPQQPIILPFPDQKEIPPNTSWFLFLFNSTVEIQGLLSGLWTEA